MAHSPEHYGHNWDVGDFIHDQGLNFFLGSAIKYICRCEYKGDKRKDLTKAIHYIQHELDKTQSDWDDTIRSSGGIPRCLQSYDEWESEADSKGFD
jgi:hypothetical protein